MLLSESPPDVALAVGERIRAAVGAGFDGADLTLSVGIAELPGDASVDLDAALAAADRALYDAKRRGGNCVSFVGVWIRCHDPRLIAD